MTVAVPNDVLEAFLLEAGELVDRLGDQLVALEAEPENDELLNSVFRTMHSIKGGASFLPVQPMVELTHRAENLLDAARHHRVELRSTHIDCLLQAIDVLVDMMETLRDGATVSPAPRELLDQLCAFLPEDACAGQAAMEGIDDGEFEALLDRIHGKDGAPGKVPTHAATGAVGDTPTAGTHHTETTVRVDTTRIDALVNAAGELVLIRNRLSNLASQGTDSRLERAMDDLNRITGELQAAALGMRMQPIGQLFQRFPRIVRDIARKLGKQVVLEQHGGDTNLDRTLVEALADPLIHLLRNAIDHGVEDPESRVRAGKPPCGTVSLGARQEGERILVSVHDDGRGMDADVLRKAALNQGVITAEQARALTPEECRALIFRPGFTTSGDVSDISGRGVGMDVVRTAVAALGGTVRIDSTVGVGTAIRIGLPLTLAIMPVLMVRVGERALALPLANVTEVFESARDRIRPQDGRVVPARRGRPLPLSDLAAWVGVPATPHATRVHIVVVQAAHRKLGLLVTQVLGREQVMIKPLGAHIRHVPGINGATITADGRIALVVDPIALAEHPVSPTLQLVA